MTENKIINKIPPETSIRCRGLPYTILLILNLVFALILLETGKDWNVFCVFTYPFVIIIHLVIIILLSILRGKLYKQDKRIESRIIMLTTLVISVLLPIATYMLSVLMPAPF
jgi:hypothetical protein